MIILIILIFIVIQGLFGTLVFILGQQIMTSSSAHYARLNPRRTMALRKSYICQKAEFRCGSTWQTDQSGDCTQLVERGPAQKILIEICAPTGIPARGLCHGQSAPAPRRVSARWIPGCRKAGR